VYYGRSCHAQSETDSLRRILFATRRSPSLQASLSLFRYLAVPTKASSRANLLPRMKKNESIQILRAVAALLVVHIHAIFMVELNAIPRQVNFFNLAGFGACGVDIFFAISGFILSTVAMTTKPGPPKFTHNAWDFLFRRFIRIFPIYWFLTLFFVALAIKQHHLTVPLLVNSYLLLPSLSFPMPAPVIFVGWTLIFEMFFYYLITLNLFWGNYRSVERTVLQLAFGGQS
jgi:exopolysaccharide production protein ExoZ